MLYDNVPEHHRYVTLALAIVRCFVDAGVKYPVTFLLIKGGHAGLQTAAAMHGSFWAIDQVAVLPCSGPANDRHYGWPGVADLRV